MKRDLHPSEAYAAGAGTIRPAVVATITRSKYFATPGSNQRFAWYWGYELKLTGDCKACGGACRSHAFGRHPLASIRRSAKEWGATSIVESWKADA